MLKINKGQRKRREIKQVLFKGKNQTQQKRVPKTGPRKISMQFKERLSSKEKGNTGNNDS